MPAVPSLRLWLAVPAAMSATATMPGLRRRAVRVLLLSVAAAMPAATVASTTMSSSAVASTVTTALVTRWGRRDGNNVGGGVMRFEPRMRIELRLRMAGISLAGTRFGKLA